MKLTPKKWEEFQHYKDRAPTWIKLHKALLDDFEFASLPVESRALAPMLWLLASEGDNGVFDATIERLAFRLRQTPKEIADALHPLIESGFFVVPDGSAPAPEKWPSRYVSEKVKSAVMERDGHQCVACGGTIDLEIDHKVPVSKGGESVEENLQVLCRPCNRSKRVKTAEQFATQRDNLRSLEKEREEEKRKRERATSAPDRFDDFWKGYPKTPVMSKKEALASWKKLSPDDQSAAIAALSPFKEWLAKQRDHPVVHACRFLSQRRFEGFKPSFEVVSSKVFVREGTEAWAAWQAIEKTPCVNSGWYFESEYPPGYEHKAA